MLQKEFLVNLADSRYAKVSAALVLNPKDHSAAAAGGHGAPVPARGLRRDGPGGGRPRDRHRRADRPPAGRARGPAQAREGARAHPRARSTRRPTCTPTTSCSPTSRCSSEMSEIDTDRDPATRSCPPRPRRRGRRLRAVRGDRRRPAPRASDLAGELDRLRDVPVELAVEIGRTRMTIGETLALGPGSIITLNRLAGEPVDLLVNGKPIARGEVVVIDEEFGLRVTEVVSGARAPGPRRRVAGHSARMTRALAAFWRKAYEDNVTGMAAMVAYNLILSVFPLALVALFVAGRVLVVGGRRVVGGRGPRAHLPATRPSRPCSTGCAACASRRPRWGSWRSSPRCGSRARSGARSTPRSAASTTASAARGCGRSCSASGCWPSSCSSSWPASASRRCRASSCAARTTCRSGSATCAASSTASRSLGGLLLLFASSASSTGACRAARSRGAASGPARPALVAMAHRRLRVPALPRRTSRRCGSARRSCSC